MDTMPEDGEVSVAAIGDSNNAVKDDIVSTASPSCAESDYSHDTLGLHWEDAPQEGGVLPNATESVGSISAITSPKYFLPVNQIQVGNSNGGKKNPRDNITAGDTEDGSSEQPSSTHSFSIGERKQLASENLEAGLLALRNGDFALAVEFFACGRKCLGPNPWEVNFDTMLKLCSEEAKATFITGDFDTMNVHIDEILSKDIPITDKYKAYEVKILYVQEVLQNFQKSLDIAIDVRRQLGMQAPKNKPHSTLKIVYEFLKTNRALGKMTAEDLLASLPDLSDERVIMGIRVLNLMGNASFSVQPTLFPIISCLSTKETLKHGLCTPTSSSLAGFAILLCSFGNPKQGRELARAAELITLKPDMKEGKARTTYLCEGLVNHWTLPLHGTLSPLLSGYNTGLKTGNIQDASLNQCFYVAHTYFAGLPLKDDVLNETSPLQIMNDIETFASVDKGDSRLDTHLANHIHYLVSAKLRGIELEGMDFCGILKYCTDTSNEALRGYVYVAQVELKVFFGEWLEATNLLAEAGELLPSMVGLYQGVRYVFVYTLVYIKTAQSSTGHKRRKLKKKALKKMKIIRGWVKNGNVNCVHTLHLLEAELAILDGSNDNKVVEKFKLAIEIASKTKFLHDEALSHELASMHFKSRGNQQQRGHHMEKAIKSYTEWGATEKVSLLECGRLD